TVVGAHLDLPSFPTRRSSDLGEKQEIGFETTEKWRLRLVGYPHLLGAQSKVEWQGKRYSIEGEPRVYSSGSARTSHVSYRMVRRSEEHTSELQSRFDLVCRLL